MPGRKYRSIKKPKMYESLRRKGYPKAKAARMANADAAGTLNRKGGRRRKR